MNLYDKALVLRRKGYSYNEINAKLRIPKSTLSGWFRDVELSKKAQMRIHSRVAKGVLKGLVKRNRMQTFLARERAQKIRSDASVEIGELNNDQLKTIGISLYWAEGYKRLKVIDGKERTAHSISLTNADPLMVKTFVLFLENCMGISRDKMKLNLRLFSHMRAEHCINYWSRQIGLPASQFDRPSFVVSSASKGIRPKDRLPYGTIQVRVADTKAFYRLMGWIDGYGDKLAQIKINR